MRSTNIGAVAVFTGQDSAGTVALLGIGAVLAAIAAFGERVQDLAVGPARVTSGPANPRRQRIVGTGHRRASGSRTQSAEASR